MVAAASGGASQGSVAAAAWWPRHGGHARGVHARGAAKFKSILCSCTGGKYNTEPGTHAEFYSRSRLYYDFCYHEVIEHFSGK